MPSLYTVLYYEDGDECRTQEFLDGLTGDCGVKAYLLLERLADNGPSLAKTRFAKSLKGTPLWELIDHCQKRAIRFYYWQSGPAEYTIACGELKEGHKPSRQVLRYAKACRENWKSRGAHEI